MKRIYTILVALLLTASVFAQAPEKMSYQAVIRNSSDQLVTSTNIGMQISILQGSVGGTEVYIERHFPTTNTNGLVSLEIGTGTIVSGNFTTIDWANDIYFIKTETDLNGGATYTITGTNQFLSVPYSMYAKTAGTADYDNLTNLPVLNIANWNTAFGWGDHSAVGYLTSEDDGSITNEIQDLDLTSNNLTITNNTSPTTIDLSPYLDDQTVTFTNGNGISVTGAYPNFTVAQTAKYQIGDFAQGGIVFWLDETGEHGLVCAKTEQTSGLGVRWYAGTNGDTQAKGDGPYAGEANTAIIIAAHVAIGDDGDTYAARLCNELQITEGGKTYGDWYLPSKQELYLMFQNKETINLTAIANDGNLFEQIWYWSSTEFDSSSVWLCNFDEAENPLDCLDNFNKFLDAFQYVRAVRAF